MVWNAANSRQPHKRKRKKRGNPTAQAVLKLSSHHPPIHLYVRLSCMHVSNMRLCVVQATGQRQPAHGNLSLQMAGELIQAMPSVWLLKPQLHTRINFSIQGVTGSRHLSDFICTNIYVLISIDRIQQVSPYLH